MGAWRAEVLDISPSLSLERTTDAEVSPRPARRRSAVAALREFFDLSPLWLRAAGAAAVLAFCALAALTLARAEVRWDDEGFALRTVRERVVRETVYASAPSGPSRQELDALSAVNQSMKAELESLRKSASVLPVSTKTNDTQTSPRPAADARRNNARRNERALTRRRERSSQFARYDDEDNLPRLSDLLDEVN